jgi:putative FmdB family regulatory protein
MPIYEYECTKCGHQSEAWQKFSETPLIECNLCNGKMKRLISQSTFHLKGTGWYVTDYASKSASKSGGDSEKGKKTGTKTSSTDSGGSAEKSKKKDSSAE